MSELKNSDIHLSRKRPLSRGSYGAESEGESTTGSDNGDVGGGNYETKLMKRERNRQTAKLNRDRKKEEAKELQDTVQYLKRKNQELQSELNSQPCYLADEQRLVMSFERHFSSQVTSVLNLLRLRAGSDSGAFYVINAASHFFPIIYASPALVELTGYALHEIIGQNCGFLSGLQTSRNERERLNLALQQGQDIAATLLNYRRDGSMFWNNLHLANLHSRVDNEEVPHLIVGLHTEVFAKRSLVIDSSSTEKDDQADSGSSNRSQQSGPGSHFTGSNFTSGGPSGAGASCGSASKGGNGASAEGRKHSDVASNHSTLPVPGPMELRRVSSDDDDHTILQEILTTHQRGLTTSSTSTSNYVAQRPGTHARHSRGKGSLLNIAGRGVRTRAMLEHTAPVLCKSTSATNNPMVNVRKFPVATDVYHSPVPEPRFAAAVQSPRCNSVMSSITADGTDNEASGASPANVLHLNAHDMSCIEHAVQRCESTNSLASETAPLSNYFASTSLGNQPKNSAFTSLASLTPKMTPSRSLPGPFPGLQGLSSGALRHLGVESFNSPPCRVGEVPLFQHPAAPPRRSNSAASNVSNSSGTSSVHETTRLRRNYYSALQEHFTSENHSGELQVNKQNLPRTSASVLGSPLLPASPGSAFTPNVNTPFQVVRRVSLGEEADMLSGRTTHATASSSAEGVKQVAFMRHADSTVLGNRVTRRGAEDTTRENLEQDFDQELASYMDPTHAQRTPLQQHCNKSNSFTGGAGLATLLLTSASADDVWASWETGTIVDALHVSSSRPNAHNLNAALAVEGPVTPVNMPRAPVGCAPLEVSATGATTTVTFGAPALQVRW